jgi:hypothetical protein
MEASDAGDQFDAALVAQYARNNALGFSLLTVAYLTEHGLSVEDWAGWMGRRFAGPETNWEPGMGAASMAREAALELVSSNARLIDFSGDGESSEVRVEWPSGESLSNAGLEREDIDAFWQIWHPLAASVGLEFDFTRDGEVTTLRFTKAR